MRISVFITLLLFYSNVFSQSPSNFQETALSKGRAYEDLKYLCKNIGNRLSGSVNAQKAVEFGFAKMKDYGFDTVYLQPVMVPHWERGKTESCNLVKGNKFEPLRVKMLGGSVGTNGKTISGEVVEVKSFVELEQLGKERLKGKVILFNRAMDPRFRDTFRAYSNAVDQRGDGAWQAARYGAAAVLVRSMTLKKDNNPHTGTTRYQDSLPRIPAMAISTEDADRLSTELKLGYKVSVSLSSSAIWFPEALSYNVIGELKGIEKSLEIISVGGHLDSWDVGEGAHDDGAGVIHALEAIRILKVTGYRPKHTIRCVWFMNEENGNKGGLTYAAIADSLKEKHIAAIESDRGGFSPEAFSVDGSEDFIKAIQGFVPQLKETGVSEIYAGYGGVDIGPLKKYYKGINLIGLVPDPQRYFDYHHADTDVFEAVNERELALGAAAIASFVYLLDLHL